MYKLGFISNCTNYSKDFYIKSCRAHLFTYDAVEILKFLVTRLGKGNSENSVTRLGKGKFGKFGKKAREKEIRKIQ